MSHSESRPLNRLLATLPPEEYRRIAANLTVRSLTAHHTLQRRGEPLREIYFPNRSLCSFIITMDDGTAAEIAVVGSEELIGVEAVLGLDGATCDARVQVKGDGVAHAMTVDAFRRELDQRAGLYANVTKYAHVLVGFVTQSVACNGLHSAEARCCRWLLHAQDRLASREFPLTHALVSTMLGVRRPTVTLIIADLVRLGIISTVRGMVRITDRPALEAHACECYKTVKAVFDNLLPFDSITSSAYEDESWQNPVALTT